jgi:hypothetical protein
MSKDWFAWAEMVELKVKKNRSLVRLTDVNFRTSLGAENDAPDVSNLKSRCSNSNSGVVVLSHERLCPTRLKSAPHLI